jgi:hypothetical protein
MDEITDAQGQVTLKLRNDGSGLKGPVIEITTLDGLMAGEYTLAMTRDGFMARIPPPKQLLKTAVWRGNKISSTQPAAIGYPVEPAVIGYGQVPPAFPTQNQSYAHSSRGSGAQEQGYIQAPRAVDTQKQGYAQDPRGFATQEQGYGQAPRTLDAPIRGYQQPSQSFDSQRQGAGPPPRGLVLREQSFGPTRTGTDRFYNTARVGAQPPRPVPAQRIPNSTTPRRAPVPPNAFSQSQSQGGYGQPQGQSGFDQNLKSEKTSDGGCCCFGGGSDSDQTRPVNGQAHQGFDKNSKREKGSGGGCCFGSSNSKESSRPPARSAYDRLGESEKERKKREKKERKKSEEMMKKQKKGRSGGPETSGFYGKKQSSRGCCGLSCC